MRCRRRVWTGDFLSETTDHEVHSACRDLVDFGLMDAAMGNGPVQCCAREIGKYQTGQKYDECQNNYERSTAFAPGALNRRRVHAGIGKIQKRF